MATPPKSKLMHAEQRMPMANAAELIRYRWEQ